MSSVTVRRFLASPVRLSSETWAAITCLICGKDSQASAEFSNVSAIASCLVNDQAFEKHPMVLRNKGPRLRCYCRYGEEAISAENKNEDALSWRPTAEEWHAFLPCLPEDVNDMAAAMKAKSSKFTVYDIESGILEDEGEDVRKSAAATEIVDWGAFKNQ